MIVKALDFEWVVTESGVQFKVWQNYEHILIEKYYSRGIIPPLNEKITLLRKAGKSEEVLDSIIKSHLQAKKDSAKDQEKLDAIFMKFNIKPAKKKVLKPVIKKS